MATTRSYPSRQLWELYRGWISRNRRLFVTATAGILVLLVVETLVLRLTVPSTPTRFYVLGLVHAVLVVAWIVFPFLSFLATSPRAMSQLRGALGEDNTRDELAWAKRRGVVWGSVHSIPLNAGDLDHLVVTRRGGVVAIDSKWRTDTRDVEEMTAAGRRTRLRAEALTNTVLSRERSGGRRSAGRAVHVHAVVVLWGAIQNEVPAGGVNRDGVTFLAGRDLRAWLRGLDGDRVTRVAGKDLLRRIETYRTRVRTTENSGTPPTG